MGPLSRLRLLDAKTLWVVWTVLVVVAALAVPAFVRYRVPRRV